MSDWRLYCHGRSSECAEDHAKGAMTYPEAMSADACDAIVRDLEAAQEHYVTRFGEETARRVLHACLYGLAAHAVTECP